MRYAANQTVAAARERFPARLLTKSDGDLYLVSIEIDATVLHLTRQENLDGLAPIVHEVTVAGRDLRLDGCEPAG